MSVHPDRITLVNSVPLQVVQNAGISEPFLEECEALFGIQIRVAEHLVDLRTFDDKDLFALCILCQSDCVRQIFGDKHLLREIFLFVDYLLRRNSLKQFQDCVEKLFHTLACDR